MLLCRWEVPSLGACFPSLGLYIVLTNSSPIVFCLFCSFNLSTFEEL